METPTPIWKTPAFWRKLAEEWRGPETHTTFEGICYQLANTTTLNYDEWDDIDYFLHSFAPADLTSPYFFPIGDRASRAALCDKIADHLEHENQT